MQVQPAIAFGHDIDERRPHGVRLPPRALGDDRRRLDHCEYPDPRNVLGLTRICYRRILEFGEKRGSEPGRERKDQRGSEHRQWRRSEVCQLTRLGFLVVYPVVRRLDLRQRRHRPCVLALCIGLLGEITRGIDTDPRRSRRWRRPQGRELLPEGKPPGLCNGLNRPTNCGRTRGQCHVHRIDAADGAEGIPLALYFRKLVEKRLHLGIRGEWS